MIGLRSEVHPEARSAGGERGPAEGFAKRPNGKLAAQIFPGPRTPLDPNDRAGYFISMSRGWPQEMGRVLFFTMKSPSCMLVTRIVPLSKKGYVLHAPPKPGPVPYGAVSNIPTSTGFSGSEMSRM